MWVGVLKLCIGIDREAVGRVISAMMKLRGRRFTCRRLCQRDVRSGFFLKPLYRACAEAMPGHKLIVKSHF